VVGAHNTGVKKALLLGLALSPLVAVVMIGACSSPETHPPLLPDCPNPQCTNAVVIGGGVTDGSNADSADVAVPEAGSEDAGDADADATVDGAVESGADAALD
jgi:hypothetical protein